MLHTENTTPGGGPGYCLPSLFHTRLTRRCNGECRKVHHKPCTLYIAPVTRATHQPLPPHNFPFLASAGKAGSPAAATRGKGGYACHEKPTLLEVNGHSVWEVGSLSCKAAPRLKSAPWEQSFRIVGHHCRSLGLQMQALGRAASSSFLHRLHNTRMVWSVRANKPSGVR